MARGKQQGKHMVKQASLKTLKSTMVKNTKHTGKNRGTRINNKTPRTFSQVRKHVTQMSKEDINQCIRLLGVFKGDITLSSHLLKRGRVKFDVEDVISKLSGTTKALKKSIVEYSERYSNGEWLQRITLLIANKEVYFDNEIEASKGHLEVCIDISHRTLLTGYFREDDSRKQSNIDLSLYIPSLEIRGYKKGGYIYSNEGLDTGLKDYYDSVYKEDGGSKLSQKISQIATNKKGLREVKTGEYLKKYVKTGYNGLDYQYISLVVGVDSFKEVMSKIQNRYPYPVKVGMRLKDDNKQLKYIIITDKEEGYSNIRKSIVKDFQDKKYGRLFYFGTIVEGEYELDFIIKNNEEKHLDITDSNKGVKELNFINEGRHGIEVYEVEGYNSYLSQKYKFSELDMLEKRLPNKVQPNFEVHTNGDIYYYTNGEKVKCEEFEENRDIKVVGYTDEGEELIRSKSKLLASAFIRNPNKYNYVTYKDKNYKNLRLDNLEWGSKEDYNFKVRGMGITNNKKCYGCSKEVGINLLGFCKSCYVLLNADPMKREERKYYREKLKIKQSVSRIPLYELTDNQMEKMKLRKEGKKYTEIAEDLGVSYQAVYQSILRVLSKYPKQDN